MRAIPLHLSKSDFKIGRSCPTKLFYKKAGYANRLADDPYLAMLAQGGYMVELLAKARYPGGIEFGDRDDPAAAWAETAAHVRAGDTTLFEATLFDGKRYARVDILQRVGQRLRLVEVKSKSWDSAEEAARAAEGRPGQLWSGRRNPQPSSAWRPYLEDVTFQVLLLESLFPEFIVEPYLCLVDASAHCTIDLLPGHFELVGGTGAEGRARGATVRIVGDAPAIGRESLTVEVPVAASVAALRDEVEQATRTLLDSLDPSLTRTTAPLTTACKDCEFRFTGRAEETPARHGFAECWGPLAAAAPSILDLYQVSRLRDPGAGPLDGGGLADALIAEGRASLLDIPSEVVDRLQAGGPVSRRQFIQITHTRAQQPWVGPGLRTAVESAAYPLYFIDFEAARTAVPFHAGMRPFGLLAFQWSCHVVDAPGATPRHLEWINLQRQWPNRAFAESLADALGPSGTVLTWSPFEASTLRTIRDELSERGASNSAMARLFALVAENSSVDGPRLLDMHRVAQSDFFHPGMGGRTSIKVVLDALWRTDDHMRRRFEELTGKRGDPEKGPYSALEPLRIGGVEQTVAEGTGAIRAYEALVFGRERHDPEVQDAWRRLLVEYCRLDTLAMVLIWEHWQRIVS